jgi:hypothetical protein
MKKLTKSLVILALVVVAIGSYSVVSAQDSTPDTATGFGNWGGRRGHSSSGGLMYHNSDGTGDGLLHDMMIADFADALGMDAEDVETRIAEGETLAEIADLPIDEFRTLMIDIRTQVHDQAVEDGLLPESRVNQFHAYGGGMGRFGGRHGAGQGLYGSGNCPID